MVSDRFFRCCHRITSVIGVGLVLASMAFSFPCCWAGSCPKKTIASAETSPHCCAGCCSSESTPATETSLGPQLKLSCGKYSHDCCCNSKSPFRWLSLVTNSSPNRAEDSLSVALKDFCSAPILDGAISIAKVTTADLLTLGWRDPLSAADHCALRCRWLK